jgi:hypothetical protein
VPLTSKGREILRNMTKQYGAKKGKSVLYASKNAGKISGIDRRRSLADALREGCSVGDAVQRVRDAAAKKPFDSFHAAYEGVGDERPVTKRVRDAMMHRRGRDTLGGSEKQIPLNHLSQQAEDECDCAGMMRGAMRDALSSGKSARDAIRHAVTKHRAFHGDAVRSTGDDALSEAHTTAAANGFVHQGTGSLGSHVYKHAKTGNYLQLHSTTGGYRARVTGAGKLVGHTHANPSEAVRGAISKSRPTANDARTLRDKRLMFIGALRKGKSVRDAVKQVRDIDWSQGIAGYINGTSGDPDVHEAYEEEQAAKARGQDDDMGDPGDLADMPETGMDRRMRLRDALRKGKSVRDAVASARGTKKEWAGLARQVSGD